MDALLTHLSKGLLISQVEAEKTLQDFCQEIKRDLSLASSLFSSFGHWSFDRNETTFRGETWHHANLAVISPVPLAIHADASHLIRVGDSEKSSEEMQDTIRESKKTKNRFGQMAGWVLIAIIIGLFTYLFASGLFNADLGFQRTIPVQEPPSNHQKIR
jgi:hypothetical protein